MRSFALHTMKSPSRRRKRLTNDEWTNTSPPEVSSKLRVRMNQNFSVNSRTPEYTFSSPSHASSASCTPKPAMLSRASDRSPFPGP